MKFTSILFCILFFAFLSTPTLVTLIEKHNDVSMFYNFAEEEIHKDIKVFKEVSLQNYTRPCSNSSGGLNLKIIYENMSRHDNVTEKIFSPPPELV